MVNKLLSICLLLIIAQCGFAAVQVGSQTITLHNLSAVSDTGFSSPTNNGYCHQAYQNYDNQSFTLNYSIDPQTQIGSATAIFAGQSFKLEPEGIANRYSFASDSTQGNILLVVGTMDKSLSVLTALIKLKGGDGFYCALQ